MDNQLAAFATFPKVADFRLVSHALPHECIIVSHEVPADITIRIKVLNDCIDLGRAE